MARGSNDRRSWQQAGQPPETRVTQGYEHSTTVAGARAHTGRKVVAESPKLSADAANLTAASANGSGSTLSEVPLLSDRVAATRGLSRRRRQLARVSTRLQGADRPFDTARG